MSDKDSVSVVKEEIVEYNKFSSPFLAIKNVINWAYDYLLGNSVYNADEDLTEEELYYKNYKEEIKKYPVILQTVDCVIIRNNPEKFDNQSSMEILLIKRNRVPGKGKLAIPGGFLEIDEKLIVGAMREAGEETSIILTQDLCQGQMTFDEPNRSKRGRVITTAFLFHVPYEDSKLITKDEDEVAEVAWYSLSEIVQKTTSDQFFEDHLDIIKKVL